MLESWEARAVRASSGLRKQGNNVPVVQGSSARQQRSNVLLALFFKLLHRGVKTNMITKEVQMSIHQETPFQRALDAIESLPIEAREDIVEIIKRRLAEDRREEIAANSLEAVKAVREKRAIYGTVEELKKELLEG